MHITHQTTIAAPPEQLWTWIEDPEKQKQWMKGLLENRSTSDQATGVGATFEMKIQEGGRVALYDGEVTRYDPPRRMTVRLSGPHMKGIVMEADYELTPVPEGTRLACSNHADAAQASRLYRMMMPLFKLFGKVQLKLFITQLKKVAEAEASPADA